MGEATINMTRSLRVENESGITGSEAPQVEGVADLRQTISAATEEELAGIGFWAERMQAIGLVSDQDADAQFLGVRYGIASIAAGPPGVVTSDLDLTDVLFATDYVRIEGSTGASNDGVYRVASVAAAPNLITLDTGHTCILQAGAGGTIAKVMSLQLYALLYEVATTVPPATITYTGNLTDIFAAGDKIYITGSAAAVNDGIWEVLTVAFTSPTTTITVEPEGPNGGAAVLGASGAGVGDFSKVRPAIELVATVPFMWSIKGGFNNPFQDPVNTTDNPLQGRVEHCMVIVAGAVNANMQARIGTNAVLPT